MTTEEALKKLEPFTDQIPLDAINTIRETWPEAEPILLAELDYRIEHPSEEDRSGLFLYALFLLAEMKSAAAFERYLTMASFPEQILDQIFGDMLTESLKDFLANTCHGRIEQLQAFIEDDAVYEFARDAGMGALELLVKRDEYSLKEMEMYCIELLTRKLKQEPGTVWDAVVYTCANLRFKPTLMFVKAAYDRGLADPQMESYESIKQRMLSDADEDRFRRRYEGLRPTEEEMKPFARWWGQQNKNSEDDVSRVLKEMDAQQRKATSPLYGGKKPGRNDPCPCGSGKKYKKCCM